MSNRFYYDQKDYITELNKMDDDIQNTDAGLRNDLESDGASIVVAKSEVDPSQYLDLQVIVDRSVEIVEMFGADGSGVADSSDAFRRASLTGRPIVCNGTYKLNSLLPNMDWRNFSGRGTALINGITFTFAYIKKPKSTFDEVRGRIAYSQSAAAPVNIAMYGDSIVMGANTTGVIENSIDSNGNAVGNNNHTAEAPNAFSNKLLALFQEWNADIGSVNRVGIWNAGYSGMSIATGWANYNYEKAVIKNPFYGLPDLVGIEFSINDSHTSPQNSLIDPNIFAVELDKLIAKILGYGGVPFMITPPEIFAVTGYDSRGINSIYDQVKKGFAEKYNLKFLDMGKALEDWFSLNDDQNGPTDPDISTGVRVSSKMYQFATVGLADRVHPGDRTHAFMASYLFSQLCPNMMYCTNGSLPSVSATSYPWRLRVIDAGSGTSVVVPHTSQFGGDIQANNSMYTPSSPWNVGWIWNDSNSSYLVYRSGDVNAIRSGQTYMTRADANPTQVIQTHTNNFLYDEVLPNDGAAPFTPALSADRPHVLCKLGYGLNHVKMFAPANNSYEYFPGALQVVSGLDVGYSKGLWDSYSVSRNLLQECGVIYKKQSTGNNSYSVKESPKGVNWVSFGRTGKTTSINFEIQMDGVALMTIVGGHGKSHKKVNGGIYRDNPTQIKLVLFREGFNGAIANGAFATFSYTKTGMQRIRVDMTRTGANQSISLYDGWGTDTLIGTWVSDNGAATPIIWPWAGHFGDHYLEGNSTLECKSAVITYF